MAAPSEEKQRARDEYWATISRHFDSLVSEVQGKRGAANAHNVGTMMDAYTACYQMMKAGWEDFCHVRALDLCRAYLRVYEFPEGVLEDCAGEELLNTVAVAWHHYRVIVKWCSSAFKYMESFYFKKRPGKPNVASCLYGVFRDTFFQCVNAKVTSIILDEMRKDRLNEATASVQFNIARGVDIYVSVSDEKHEMYRDFEDKLIEDTEEYYTQIARDKLIEAKGSYFRKVEQLIREEKARAIKYLPSCTHQVLIAAAERALLEPGLVVLQDKVVGFLPLLVDERFGELKAIYSLYNTMACPSSAGQPTPLSELSRRHPLALQRDGVELIAKAVGQYIVLQGTKVNEKFLSTPDCLLYIEELCALYTKTEELFELLGEGEAVASCLPLARANAFRDVLSKKLTITNKSGRSVEISAEERVGVYCDRMLIKKECTEQRLQGLLYLACYLKERDLFEEVYWRGMARRLLSVNPEIDMERHVVGSFKRLFGCSFTRRMESMIHDKESSGDLRKRFDEYLMGHGALPCDFGPQVITHSQWPTYRNTHAMNIPNEMQLCLNAFTQFYMSTHQQRILTWILPLSSVVLECRFESSKIAKSERKKKEISMNIIQACILLQLNDSKSLSVRQCAQTLGIEVEAVRRNVASMAEKAQHKMLRTYFANSEDHFSVNEGFATNLFKFRIPFANEEIAESAKASTASNRRFITESTIVRVMKSRKQLTHTELASECLRLLATHFSPDPKSLKGHIESLIDRQFLERDAEDRNVYRYLA